MGLDTFWGVCREFSDLHRKISGRSVCDIASLIQTSENVCIPDVSTNSVLVLWYVAFFRLGRRNMS